MKQNYILQKVVLVFLMVFGITITTNTAYGQKLEKSLDIYQDPVTGKTKDLLNRQVVWADFNNATNLGPNNTLQIGTVLTLKPMKGYVIKCTVTKLAPFRSTQIYKDRVDADPNATQEARDSYDANAKNWRVDPRRNYDGSGYIMAEPQTRYSNLKVSGMPVPGKSTLSTVGDGCAVGVEFTVSATYFGTPTKPAVIVTDGEEQTDNGREWTAFTTDGTPWEMLANVAQAGGTPPVVMPPSKYGKKGNEKSIGKFPNYYVDKNSIGATINDKTIPHCGLGSQFFGGFSNYKSSKFSNPLVISKGITTLGVYIDARGKQASMFGFVAMDEGDAPSSYGSANHLMKKVEGDPITDQPFVGTTKGDMDLGLPGAEFFRDDIHGPDEGEFQLLGVDEIAGTTQTGIKNYPIHIASNENYELPVLANRGGKQDAYFKAWADFNGDGKFTENEASQVAHLTAGGRDGKITFKFNNKRQLTKVDLLNFPD